MIPCRGGGSDRGRPKQSASPIWARPSSKTDLTGHNGYHKLARLHPPRNEGDLTMAANVFVSFDHDDQVQVGGFRSLKSNPKHPLDFHDHSLREPVLDRNGRPIRFPPSDPRSEPVRREISAKFERSSRLVVLIGDNTHRSEWVDWEVNTFYGMKEKIAGDKTWKRIRGMTLRGSESARVPPSLAGQSTKVLSWDPEALDKWLDQDPDV